MMNKVPISAEDLMMPMLSRSHRTTAPAMATEPWEEEEMNLCDGHNQSINTTQNDAFTHLESITRRLVLPQFVGDRGQQAVVGDDGLEREQ